MKQYVEIDESNLRYYDVIDFEDGATFHTSLNTTITISGNFRKQYKLGSFSCRRRSCVYILHSQHQGFYIGKNHK